MLFCCQGSSEDEIPIFTRKRYDFDLGNQELGASEIVDSEQFALCSREAAHVSVQSLIDFNTDVSFLLPSAVERMLQELESPPDKFKSLTDLFTRLSDVSAKQRNCGSGTVSFDADDTITESADIYSSEISHKMQKKKSGHKHHLSDARARITKLKENSREMVSMFIPPDAPKLSFLSNLIGM